MPELKDLWNKVKEWTLHRLKGIEKSAFWQETLPVWLARLQKFWSAVTERVSRWKATVWIREKWALLIDKGKVIRSSESLQQQKERWQSQSKTLADKVQSQAKNLGEKASPLKEKAAGVGKDARQSLAEKASRARAALKEPVKMDQVNFSGLPGWLEKALLRLTRISWIRRLSEWWLNLSAWSSRGVLFRILLPTLAVVSLLLFVSGLGLHLSIRASLNRTETDLKTEASQSLLDDIYQEHGNFVRERSAELEQIILDNVVKGDLLAEAPTFQDLNIQKMEEFSRSLLRKDTNLLNVVVLTNESVKKAVRTRRIGDTTRFIFTCCELPVNRSVSYQEIDERQWLGEVAQRKNLISDLYVNPANGESFWA
jgi:hypothetical protein